MQHCHNCEKSLPADRFDLHLGYCRRNIKRCAQCNRPYDINNAEEHHQEFHNVQQCQYCHCSIAARQIDQHKRQCSHKPIQCIYCQNSVPTDKYEQHKRHCESRTKTCEMCQKLITNKDYFNHVSSCTGKPVQIKPQPSSNTSYYTTYTSSNQQNYTSVTYVRSNNSYTSPQYASSYSSSNYISASSSQPTYSYTTNSISSGANSEPRSPVIRTYIRTYAPGSNEPILTPTTNTVTTTSQATSYASSASSNYVPAQNYSTTSESLSQNQYTPSGARIISRRVISTSVLTPEEYAQSTTTTSTGGTGATTTTTTTYQSPTVTYRSPSNSLPSSYTASTSGTYGMDEDHELQAALYASLGYQDQNSAAMYQMIQNQHLIESQFKK